MSDGWNADAGKLILKKMGTAVKKWSIAASLICGMATWGYAQGNKVSDYDVSWEVPSENSAGSMPLGNGELGMNVWVEKNGDLLLYLSRTDALSEANRLMKLGRIRVAFSPNPFLEGKPFMQRLVLEEGVIRIQAGDAGKELALDVYIDPDRNVAYVNMEGGGKYQVKVTAESWRREPHKITRGEALSAWLNEMPEWVDITESADQFQQGGKEVLWYHANERSVYDLVISHQQLQEHADNFPDPIKNRIFGVELSAKGLKKESDSTLVSPGNVGNIALKIATHSAQAESLEQWKKELKVIAEESSAQKAYEASSAWWRDFWNRSYVYVDTPEEPEFGKQLTQSYILQRYMLAGSGRGHFPIKFNGSIFTTDPQYTNASMKHSPDYRNWGNDFWWQNTRLPYYAMLMNGDFDLMKSVFDFYLGRMDAFRTLAKKYYGAEGAFIPETMTVFGTYANGDYGWNREGHSPNEVLSMYIRHIWVQSLELSKLLLDYASYNGDEEFLKETALPAIREFIAYFESRFTGADGRMRITPTQAVETYWYEVENDMPVVAGLHYVLREIGKLPDSVLTNEDRTYYQKVQKSLPPLPQKQVAEGTLFLPAETFLEKRTNVENPELYVVFPFALANVTNDLKQAGIRTFRCRNFDGSRGWGQDGQEAAILGLEEDAVALLRKKIKNTNVNHRFLAMWGPNFDWVPDQDHGSNILLTVQQMILQHYDGTSYLLPCWPKGWNVSFKLYTPGKHSIEGTYLNGKLSFSSDGNGEIKSFR